MCLFFLVYITILLVSDARIKTVYLETSNVLFIIWDGFSSHRMKWKQTNKRTSKQYQIHVHDINVKWISLALCWRQQHSTLFAVHALLHVCFYFPFPIDRFWCAHSFRTHTPPHPSHVPLHSLICNFKMFFLANCSAWIYWFATSSAFFLFIISASFAFIFLIFLVCRRCCRCCYCYFLLFQFQSTTECDSADVVQFNVIVGCDCLLSSIENAFASLYVLTSFFSFRWFHSNAFSFDSIEFRRNTEAKRKTSTNTQWRCIGMELMLIPEIFSLEIYILNGTSEKHSNTQTYKPTRKHGGSAHTHALTLCDWSVMECSGVRVEMWWNCCSMEWFMAFFMCMCIVCVSLFVESSAWCNVCVFIKRNLNLSLSHHNDEMSCLNNRFQPICTCRPSLCSTATIYHFVFWYV